MKQMGDVEGPMDSEQTSSSTVDTVTSVSVTAKASTAESVSSSHQKDYVVVDLESQDTTHRLQTILTLQWLSQHYEAVEGVSLPRCLIYKHYSEYCQKHQFCPINAASFGKVIRQVFPELRTRRLGTRGQSKYHYYGIRVKESSPYFGVFLDSQRVSAPALYRHASFPLLSSTAQWQSSLLQSRTDNLPSQMTSILTLLPEFPTAAQTQPWDGIEFQQVDGVISQYRCHCQQVIEDILRGKLEEVPAAVQRFWQSLPEAMIQVLQSGSSSDKLADMVALCDNILYQTMINILIPGTVQQLPPSLLHAIRNFSCGFQKVVEESLPGLTEYFHLKRVETVKRFCQLLKRKTSLSHLAQATRAVLKTKVTVTQMSHDWRKRTEQNTVCSQLMWTAPGNSANIKTVVKKCFSEFSRLLEKHASVEEHIKWLDAVRSKCLKNSGDGDREKTEEVERDFLLQWSYVCNLLIRDQTLRSATSFGSFHLLHLLYEEYLLFMVDVQLNQKQERAMWRRLFDTDKDVPSYFLTSADSCEFDSARRLSNAPFVKTEYLHRLPAQIATSHSARYPSNMTSGLDTSEGQYLFQPYAAPTGRIFAKPLVAAAAAAAGCPNQAVTLGSLTDKSARNATHSANSCTPSKSHGYLSGKAPSSPVTPTQMLTSSPHVKKEKDTSQLTFGRSPNVLTIPLGGTIAFLQTSPSRSGSSGAVTVLPSGYRMPTSPVAFAVPQVSTQQQQQQQQIAAANLTQVHVQTGTNREPPPLQPITQRHQGAPGSLNQTSLPQETQKPQQKVLATKIIKAVPVSSESKQKPVSFQFSITTNQKLNLSKGQILTTTNGERYVINEVQSSTQTENVQ
ncbi:transcription factor RFX4-like [Patiria miniata]|uniref:RFX-type winged-helix domain-containing protein n=1 Tax=Patiria miniata TaxID=46514 RepID=A0A913ZDU6_PATMI|nr:transcription factor RFX4-like [Patiria miniata]